MTIQEIVEKKAELIELKKSALKICDPSISVEVETVNKAFTTNFTDDLEKGVIRRKIVGNTYNWLDSHGDVHVGNTFKKSIQERTTKVFHLHDHKFEISAKVGKIDSIKEVDISWKDLGVDISGSTKALIAESDISKDLNKAVFDQYLSKEIDQHSVGMRYVKLDLAVNDDQYEEEYKVWKNYIDSIGNKEQAIEKGYFWAVSEAKLIEISAVLMGSNPITPTIENKIEPSKDTQNKEEPEAVNPANDTLVKRRRIN